MCNTLFYMYIYKVQYTNNTYVTTYSMQVALLDLVCVKQYSKIHCLTLLNIQQSPILYLYCWHLFCHLEFIISSHFFLCWRTKFPSILFWAQFSSVHELCLTLCHRMDCSTPALPVHHQLPEVTKTHVHWVGDAIQPSHPLSLSSPPAFNLSQHQGLFQWVSSSYQVAIVLELQHQSFQWIFRTDFL